MRKNNYTQKHFSLDDHDVSIPGWTNGEYWNGWGCPNFESSAIDEALQNGGFIQDEYFKIIKRDDLVVSIMTQGGKIPNNFDFTDVIALLKKSEEVYEYKISDDCFIDAEIFEKQTIDIEGRNVEVYAIGSHSWCWNEHDEPLNKNSLSI